MLKFPHFKTTKAMNIQDTIRKVMDIAQSKGWSVNMRDKDKFDIHFEFQRYTKYGQDFSFNATMSDEEIDALVADIKQYFEGFDPDYEASLWIGDDGHGKCGAPYHIKDIVTDMEDAEEEIYELLNALETELL